VNLAYLAAEPLAFAAGVVLIRGRPASRDGERLPVFVAMAGGSAVGAIAAGGSATGWEPLDAVLLMVLGAGAVIAGTVASRRLMFVAGLIAAALGTGSAAMPLALAATGLLLASLLKDTPILNAAGGALVTQAALRLTSPDGDGWTALAAAGILVPILLSAVAGLRRPARRIVARATLAIAGFALVSAIGAGVAAAMAAGPLRSGLDVATAAVTTDAPSDPDATAAQLASARLEFADARRTLEAWWVRPAAAVPVVAQHWRVLHAAALSGDALAGAGERALRAPTVAEVRVTDGQVPLDRLAAMAPAVSDLAAQLTDARRRLASARSAVLLPPLLDRFDTELARIIRVEGTTQRLNRALPLLPAMLGRDGPRRYFLAVQTPAEARAGGGFIGNFGEITADGGRLSLTRFGRISELDDAPGRNERQLVAPEDFAARYGRFSPEGAWTNVNLSPDFPTDAQVIAGLYPQSGGTAVDGVFAIDPAGLAAFLRLLGPVNVPGWPVPITADNAVQIMLHDQYVVTDRRERIDFLGDVALVTWQRFTSGALPAPQQLLGTLAPAAREKHLLLWSAHPEEQRLFEDIGASGRVAPVEGDFLGLVTQNANGNKIDYFLRRSVDYQVQLDPGSGRLRATATVTLSNDAPASGLPPTVIGNEVIEAQVAAGDNRLYLSLYTPWELLESRLDGALVQLDAGNELGRRVYSTGLIVPSRGSVTLVVELSGRLDAGVDDYRLDLYRQPTVAPDEITTTLVVSNGWRLPDDGRRSVEAVSMVADATIEVPVRRR
jgi:hypothetical protein